MAKRRKVFEREPNYKVLTEYEVGKCTQAITAVALHGKPVVEVMTRPAKEEDLRSDLAKFVELSGFQESGASYWVREDEESGYFRFGFYVERWVLAALEFMDKAKLSDTNRSWINGLLYGITPREIQKFIDKG